MLFCVDCGECYHECCVCPGIHLHPTAQLAWRCPACKICEVCGITHKDEDLILCDSCDKGYGLQCLKPRMLEAVDGEWICSLCVDCPDCVFKNDRTRWSTSSKKHVKCELCKMHGHSHESCQPDDAVNKCAVCEKPWGIVEGDDAAMVQCDVCEKWVHGDCDPMTSLATGGEARQITFDAYGQLCPTSKGLYACPPCAKKTDLHTAVSVSIQGFVRAIQQRRAGMPKTNIRGLAQLIQQRRADCGH